MTRLRLTVAYVGTAYCGWQTQLIQNGERPTVQSFLEAAASHIAGVPVHVHGAGRTDSGVHAEGQTAHIDVPDARMHIDWQLAMNTLLPRDIRVLEAVPVSSDFHAQFGVVSKCYEYHLWPNRRFTLPQRYPFVWACGPFDADKMRAAAQYLIGTHDFASLCNAGSSAKTTIRTITSISDRLFDPETGESIWRFEGRGFLKQMVRNCIGMLVAVGQDRLKAEDIPEILLSRDRTKAPQTAPAQGLTLKFVRYNEQ